MPVCLSRYTRNTRNGLHDSRRGMVTDMCVCCQGVTCEEMSLTAQYMIWYYQADTVVEIAGELIDETLDLSLLVNS